MGCSSCGGGSSMATPSLLASATAAGASAGKWKVTYPSGNSREFTSEWQAQASQAVGGGELEYLAPEEPVAKASTATATTTRSATAPKPAATPKPTTTRSATPKKPAPRKATRKRTVSGGDADIVDNGNGTTEVGGDGGGGD